MNKFLMWIFDNIPLGRLAPYVFGLAIGRKPHRIKTTKAALAKLSKKGIDASEAGTKLRRLLAKKPLDSGGK